MNGFIWLGAGVVLSVASRVFMRYADNKTFYTLFFWIGVAFFALGVLKILFGRKEKEIAPTTPKKDIAITYCEKCNTKNHTISNYCHLCGHKIKEAGKAIFRTYQQKP